jgi:hypothetical protein
MGPFFKPQKEGTVAMTDSLTSTDAPRPVVPKSTFDGPAERNYFLKNRQERKFLQHEDQTWGINLGWTDDAEPSTAKKVRRWFFARSGNAQGPVRYGETVALANGGKPSFMRNVHRDVGIDLDWSDAPVYEWKLLGGKSGAGVKTGEAVAIYNVHARECLFDRTAGGDIGWPSSKTWGEQLEDRIRKAVVEYADEALMALLAA